MATILLQVTLLLCCFATSVDTTKLCPYNANISMSVSAYIFEIRRFFDSDFPFNQRVAMGVATGVRSRPVHKKQPDAQQDTSEDTSEDTSGHVTLPGFSEMLEPDVASKMSRLDVCSLQSVTLKSSRQFDSDDEMPAPPMLDEFLCNRDLLPSVDLPRGHKVTDDEIIKFEKLCWNRDGVSYYDSVFYEATDDIIPRFTNSTKCYKTPPCFQCEEEVIQLVEDDQLVWNIIDFHNDNKYHDRCSDIEFNGRLVIPASTVGECIRNGGRYIKSLGIPDRKLRCVGPRCNTSFRRSSDGLWLIIAEDSMYHNEDCTLKTLMKKFYNKPMFL